MLPSREENLRQIEALTSYGHSYYLCKMYTLPAREFTLLAKRFNLHPNHLTIFSLLLGLGAGLFFLKGDRMDLIAGGLLAYLSFVFDYADGQLARWTGRVSPLGGWLDQVGDRTREFLIISGLAWGDYRHTQEVTALALGFIALFVVYMLDYYDQMKKRMPPPVSSSGSDPGPSAPNPHRRPFVIDFTIDEQYAVYTIFALLGMPRLLLGAVSLFGGFLVIYRPFKNWKKYYGRAS
jgi:phosphatidylglycerophosphate synthase